MSREIVQGERFHAILQRHVFLISLCEMLLISACVFSKQFFKEKWRTWPTSLAHDDLKTSMKTGYLVATDTEQARDKYILLYFLVCSIAEYFCELCRILTSPYGE